MDTTALIVWNSFLKGAPSEQESALQDCLAHALLEEFQDLPIVNVDNPGTFTPPENELDHIHHSWFCPFLRSLPEREIKLFLSALTSAQIKNLKQALLLSNVLPTASPLGAAYLRSTLFQSIAPQDLIPLSCLPPHPLNKLLSLSYEELLSLIDLLCMHDLSLEIKHIIDTTKLKEIYSILSKPQVTFLKTLLHKKEPVSFKKMQLQGWQKDHEALYQTLTQRGINRLAKALYPLHKSLTWYITHRLDRGRGLSLLNLSSALNHPKAYDILSEQILELLDALNNLNNS